jgi:hypothetical protein
MNPHNPSLDDRAASRASMFGTCNVGADLGAGYGAMAVITGLVATVPWERLLKSAGAAAAASASNSLAACVKHIFFRLRRFA